MGLIKVELFNPVANAGPLDLPTLSQQEVKAGLMFRLSIPVAAQERFFGRALDADADQLMLRLSDASPERLLIGVALARPDGDGLPLSKSARGSVALRLRPWVATAKGKRPVVRMPFAQTNGAWHFFRLPEWAYPPVPKPGAGKGLMDD